MNRVDELIMFAPLNEQQITDIVRLQLSGIQKLLSDSQIHLEINEEAIHFIARAGFDPQFGARPVKRAIQKLLLNDLSKAILSGTIRQNDTIYVEPDGDKLRFRN